MSNRENMCSKEVWRGFGFGHNFCTRNGSVQEDGKWWCKQHAPSAEKARDDERNRKYETEVARRKKQHAATLAQYEIVKYARELMDGVEFSQLRDKIQKALKVIDAATEVTE